LRKTLKILILLKLLWMHALQISTLLTLFTFISTHLLSIGTMSQFKMFKSSLISNFYPKWTCIAQIDFQAFNLQKEWWHSKKISQCSPHSNQKRVSLKVKMTPTIFPTERKDTRFHLLNNHNQSSNLVKKSILIMDFWKLPHFGQILLQSDKIFLRFLVHKEMNCFNI